MTDNSIYVWAGTYSGHNFCMIDTNEIIEKIKKGFSEGYRSVIFDTIDEGLYLEHVKKIHRIIKVLNVKDVDFYYLTAALNATEAYRNFCIESNIEPVIKMLVVSQFEYISKVNLTQYYNETGIKEIEYKKGPKEKLFVCFNKVLRGNRIKAIHRILKHNLIHKSFSSFHYGKEVIEALKHHDPEKMLPVFHRYRHIFPLMLNVPKDRYNPIDFRIADVEYHEKSYFSLITETLFFRNEMDTRTCVFLTEKTFRAVCLKHPFILLSTPRSLEHLKKLGYKTFAPFINEAYDLEEDDNKRFDMVWGEVQRLSRFSATEWLEWQENIIPIVEHNYKTLWNKNTFVIE